MNWGTQTSIIFIQGSIVLILPPPPKSAQGTEFKVYKEREGKKGRKRWKGKKKGNKVREKKKRKKRGGEGSKKTS